MAHAVFTYDVGDLEHEEGFADEVEHTVIILGREFKFKYTDQGSRDEIRSRASAFLWFTYRNSEYAIGDSPRHKTDRGWGCTLRVGQMIVGEALQRCHCPRDYDKLSYPSEAARMSILKEFEDRPDRVLSVHAMAMQSKFVGKRAGQWHTPTDVAHVLRLAVNEQEAMGLQVHVAMDSMVVLDDLRKLFRADRATLLFVPLRLGIDIVQAEMIPAVKRFFHSPSALGIMGGRPGAAHYFIGYMDHNLLLLDPHTTQDPLRAGSQDALVSCRCSRPMLLDLDKVDPTMCLAFLLTDEESLQRFADDYNASVEETGVRLFSMLDTKSFASSVAVASSLAEEEEFSDDDFEVINMSAMS